MSVTRLHSLVGVERLTCDWKLAGSNPAFFIAFFHLKTYFFFKNDGLGFKPLKGMVWGHFDLPMPPYFDLYHSLI